MGHDTLHWVGSNRGTRETCVHSMCIFCGSSRGKDPVFAHHARQMGQALARRQWTLVFGGGHIGLMGVIADAVLEAGGKAIGVIPRVLVEKELAHTGLTELHIVETMHQRKALMAELSDAFAALPGGVGTADELFEIITWAQLGLHRKPVGLLNTAGYFDSLLDWIERMTEEGFLRPGDRDLLLVSDTCEDLLERLQAFRPLERPEKWIDPKDL
jgi:uncharacterized protein (TIGR00730 family)